MVANAQFELLQVIAHHTRGHSPWSKAEGLLPFHHIASLSWLLVLRFSGQYNRRSFAGRESNHKFEYKCLHISDQ